MDPERQEKPTGTWQEAIRDAAPFAGIGLSLALTVLICLWIGHWLDRKLGTGSRYFLIGAGVGVLAAFLHLWRMYKALTGGKRQ
jgi:hypothetical protein